MTASFLSQTFWFFLVGKPVTLSFILFESLLAFFCSCQIKPFFFVPFFFFLYFFFAPWQQILFPLHSPPKPSVSFGISDFYGF